MYPHEARAPLRKRHLREVGGGFQAMRTAQYVWPLSIAAHFFAESAARGKRKGEAKKALKELTDALQTIVTPEGETIHLSRERADEIKFEYGVVDEDEKDEEPQADEAPQEAPATP